MAMSRTESGRLGGKARAASLSAERLSEIGRKAHLASAVKAIVDRAPELTPEQRDKLRVLLAEGR